MPTYEYRCKDCGHELDAVQAFTDDPLTECPACGGQQLKKRFGSVGISFKGSGFYKNDSRTKTTSSSSGDGDKSTADKSTGDKSTADKSPADKSASESSAASATGSSSGSSDGGAKSKASAST
jgi:putative FmdB family regulatory protein